MITKLVLVLCLVAGPAAHAATVYVNDYGAVGDGIADDGAAIHRAFLAMMASKGPKTLVLTNGLTYYIGKGAGKYLFDIDSAKHITIRGQGAIVLLSAGMGLMSVRESSDIRLSGISVDYVPLPFADGLIRAVDSVGGFIDVSVSEGFKMPPEGGPSGAPAEQAYFGMLWNSGRHGLLGTHYWVRDSKLVEGEHRVMRVWTTAAFKSWQDIKPTTTRISLPVSGVSHIGSYQVICILDAENVFLDHVNIWSAPCFAVVVSRNRGAVTFRDVNIVPKPGTGRLTSSWRDGFHVSSNYARLRWDDCRVEGTNDDAFNLKTFTASVISVKSPRRLVIRQNFPLDIVPYPKGDVIALYDPQTGLLLGKARIARSTGFCLSAEPVAPAITLELKRPIPRITAGCLLWNITSANPHTLLEHCQIFNSCRFHSPVTLDDCTLAALGWFYGDNIESPIPSRIRICNSRLFSGRGNPTHAIVFTVNMEKNGILPHSAEQPISDIALTDNLIDGDCAFSNIRGLTLRNNRFASDSIKLVLSNCRKVKLIHNVLSPAQITYSDNCTRLSTTLSTTRVANKDTGDTSTKVRNGRFSPPDGSAARSE